MIVSNASLRSNNTRGTGSPFSALQYMSFRTGSTAVSVLCQAQQADWNLSSLLCGRPVQQADLFSLNLISGDTSGQYYGLFNNIVHTDKKQTTTTKTKILRKICDLFSQSSCVKRVKRALVYKTNRKKGLIYFVATAEGGRVSQRRHFYHRNVLVL